jgi:protein-disulfide isomerase
MTRRHISLAAVAALWLAGGHGAAAQGADDYRVLGDPGAAVEMTVYSDFECLSCRNFALAVLPAIIAEFVSTGSLRLRFVHVPLAGVHENAVAAAKAAHCAGLAGRFWSFHDYAFVRQPEWAGPSAPDSLWREYAANLAIDPLTFATCFNSAETHAAIEEDLSAALRDGVTGTPTVTLNGEPLSGISTYAALREHILAAIAAARGQAPGSPGRDRP